MGPREREPFQYPVIHHGAFCQQREKAHGQDPEDGIGNGQAAGSALEENYKSHTKEARRAYHEKLHSTKIKSGDDPDDFLYTMDGFCERL